MIRRSSQSQSLGACTLLALSLHALAFWSLDLDLRDSRSTQEHDPRAALQLKLLTSSTPDKARSSGEAETDINAPSEIEAAKTLASAAEVIGAQERVNLEEASDRLDTEAVAQPDETTAEFGPVLDDSAFVIEHPDSPLPGGHASAVIQLLVNRSGVIESISISSGQLPEAFVAAVRSSFVDHHAVQVARDKHGAPVKASLCIEVHFTEAEQPRWRLSTGSAANQKAC